ncbi:MAG: type II secretion system F family protein [Bacilli bacterium]|nr:type II secretion system F family protein [Bacilli bacterium]
MVNKPIYIVLSIYVYRLVYYVTKIPILFVRLFSLGFFFTLWYFINSVLTITKELFIKVTNGFVFTSMITSRLVRVLLKYPAISLVLPIVYSKKLLKVSNRVNKYEKELQNENIEEYSVMNQELQELVNKRKVQDVLDKKRAREKAKLEKKEQRQALLRKKAKEVEDKKARALELKKQKEEAKKAKAEWREKNTYVNEAVEIKKESRKDYWKKINDTIKNLPENIKKYFHKKYNNLSFVKNARNKEDINRQALLISFEGDDAVKSDKKRVFEYVGRNSDGKLVKDYFEAFSKVEVHSFLLSEGFEVYSIKSSWFIQAMYGAPKTNKTKIKIKDLIFFITQLSTYIKAGIPLVEALKILSRQYKNKKYQRIFRAVIYDLTMGENFSDALAKQGEAFPRLLINMIKASEMTGELPESLDDMAEYYTQAEATRKQMVTAMMYPSIILVIALAAITFIMVFVIPKFVQIYESMEGAEIPSFTLTILKLSNFLEQNLVWILIGIVIFVIIFRYLYKSIKVFKTMVQWGVMHMPVFGQVVIYNEITMFTKTFASLLSHNVFITDSMEILNKLTNNEIYKMIMLDTITNLARGEKISLAFKDHWAIPLPAYEMIVTGERTGQLPEMMGKVSSYYQELHKNAVARIKTFIEPVLIILLTLIVGIIVLSIVIPMFNMYTQVQK